MVVGGKSSCEMPLQDMVYQATVWGTVLWNLFFGDAQGVIAAAMFIAIVYADGLNAFRVYRRGVANEVLLADMANTQQALHRWGRANQVAFDAGKESQHIICACQPYGPSFKILGVVFDTKLSMREAADEVVSHIKWKIVVLHRVRRYYSVSDLVMLWKSDVLSYIEYRTPAIYHACCTILKPIDDAQDRYLRDLGLSDLDALVHFRLAPLSCRRDIAMLGVIHRSVLGLGPRHFRKFVRPPWRWTAAHRGLGELM